MSSPPTYGILKFFRDIEKLNFLLDGGFYCNTPEFYRLSGDEGVSDKNESCSHSYRRERGDEPVILKINGEELEGINNLTVHNRGIKDKYLHCWFAVRIPDNEESLKVFTNSVNRMRKEFGSYYAFVRGNNVKTLVERLRKYTDLEINYGNIKYSSDPMEWSAVCKSDQYIYQQEYRFLIGDCSHIETKPYIIESEESFRDLIGSNETLQITDNETSHVWFQLDENNCFCQLLEENS